MDKPGKKTHNLSGDYQNHVLLFQRCSQQTMFEKGFAMETDAPANEKPFAEMDFIKRILQITNKATQTSDYLPVVASELARFQQWDSVFIGLNHTNEAMPHIMVGQPDTDHQTSDEPVAIPESLAPLIYELLHAGQNRITHTTDPTLEDDETMALLHEAGFQTIVSLLLRAEGEDANGGVLVAASRTPRTITNDEQHLLEETAAIVAETMHRIYKYEEQQRVNLLKSTFLAKIAHEMRNPVMSVVGFASAIESGKYGKLPETMDEPFGFLLYSSTKLRHLITDLLDFSKIEAGHLRVELSAVDVVPIVRNVIGAMSHQVEERGLTLITELAQDLPSVQSNAERLDQVLSNLLSNAIKFTDEGTITIRAEQQGDLVRLSVQDTGIGIMPEYQALIFGEYQQISDQHTIRFAGTGLGLAISRGLVELMGGELKLESEFGVGSTFFCDLRVAPGS